MEDIEVKKLDSSKATAKKAATIFVNAYYNELKDVSDSKDALIEIFSRSMRIAKYFGAYLERELVGIFALSGENERAFKVDRKSITSQIGVVKGFFVYYIMKKELESPIKMKKPGVYIEAVATDPEAQGKGVATHMMKYVITNYEHSELDVVDTNSKAISLYEKLGFKVYREETYKNRKFTKKIYMEYDRA